MSSCGSNPSTGPPPTCPIPSAAAAPPRPSGAATPASASRTSTWRTSSVPSSRPMAPSAARTEEPAWACPSAARSPTCSAAPSTPRAPRRGQLFHPVPADRAPRRPGHGGPTGSRRSPAAAEPRDRRGTAPGSLGRHGEAGLAADTHGAPPAGRRVLVVEASPRGPLSLLSESAVADPPGVPTPVRVDTAADSGVAAASTPSRPFSAYRTRRLD